ncbi:Chorion peroxidase, partial [Fragariocoptes setiger]
VTVAREQCHQHCHVFVTRDTSANDVDESSGSIAGCSTNKCLSCVGRTIYSSPIVNKRTKRKKKGAIEGEREGERGKRCQIDEKGDDSQRHVMIDETKTKLKTRMITRPKSLASIGHSQSCVAVWLRLALLSLLLSDQRRDIGSASWSSVECTTLHDAKDGTAHKDYTVSYASLVVHSLASHSNGTQHIDNNNYHQHSQHVGTSQEHGGAATYELTRSTSATAVNSMSPLMAAVLPTGAQEAAAAAAAATGVAPAVALAHEHKHEHEHELLRRNAPPSECALYLERATVYGPTQRLFRLSANDTQPVGVTQLCITYADLEDALIEALGDDSGGRSVEDDGESFDDINEDMAAARRHQRLSRRAIQQPQAHFVGIEHAHQMSNSEPLDLQRRHQLSSSSSANLEFLAPNEERVAGAAEMLLRVVRVLQRRFELSPDEVLNGLPMIDVTRVRGFARTCPLFVRADAVQCVANARFRSITGHCNNLAHPAWGAARTPFVRFVAPAYSDGVGAARTHSMLSAQVPLPAPRQVAARVHVDIDVPSSDVTNLFMSWGQLVDHDMALAAPPAAEHTCCPSEGDSGDEHETMKRRHDDYTHTIKRATNNSDLCMPIEVAPDDPFYSQFNVRCLDFRRSLAGVRENCALGVRAQIDSLSAMIDANFIYGTSEQQAAQLRTFSRGQLRTWPFFGAARKPLLPPKIELPDENCHNRPAHLFCFISGDVRANEQTHLTVLHTLYLRNHNRMAAQLSILNPHWNDERVYQETRHVQAALVQHALLSEYLPTLLGAQLSAAHNLTETPSGGHYWHSYDATLQLGIASSFATAAFRQGHTFIGTSIARVNKYHELLQVHALRDSFRAPWRLFELNGVDELTLGMVDTPTQSYDPFLTADISGHLFKRPGSPFGSDLASINIQRAREQGVPGYNQFREWCGLPRVTSFEQLGAYMQHNVAYALSLLYAHVDDIDLFTAGISEYRAPGAQIGPTFACIIGRQFSLLRRADRFWFENSPLINPAGAFTPQQLDAIKRFSLAKLLCANTDDTPTIQPYAFRLPHPIFNARVPCDSLPDIDLSAWQESVVG